MELTPKTKLFALIKEHPFLVDMLAGLNPLFAGLKNPVIRGTLGRTATLGKVAAMGGMPLPELLAAIQQRIQEETGVAPPVSTEGHPVTREERRAVLGEIIRELHAGGDREQLQKRFAELIEDVGAAEIGEMEQELIEAGMPQSEITKLCDVHLDIFKESLAEQPLPDMPPGHPVHTFMAENDALRAICAELRELMVKGSSLAEMAPPLERLGAIDLHYLRKENQLFPFLEKHGISGPPQVMWTIHDEVRAMLKAARQSLDAGDAEAFSEQLTPALTKIEDMVDKEHLVLLPMALSKLSDDEWLEMRAGEGHIGYALIEPGNEWPPEELAARGAAASISEKETPMAHASIPDSGAAFKLDTGALTPEQVNLLFSHLPVEISFTDENHIVRYFSEGGERIFPRSPGVIGRAVDKCHPPKSVHMVKEILRAFVAGERDVAEFWINFQEKMIHIRYFAVRDESGKFRGTMEVVQDVTGIRELTGECRLLDWG
jgi:DUF438 domain-containing protein